MLVLQEIFGDEIARYPLTAQGLAQAIEAQQVVKCPTRIVFTQTTTYTHCNGEATTPAEPGLYWFAGSKSGKDAHGMLHIVSGDGMLMWYPLGDEMRIPYDGLETFIGRWWGPVTPPWEKGSYGNSTF